MKKIHLLPALALGLAGMLPPAPAQAAGSVQVTSPGCGQVKVTNSTSWPIVADLDSGGSIRVAAHSSSTLGGQSSGRHVYTVSIYQSEYTYEPHHVVVRGCSGVAKRPVEGDQNGDGKADVFGVKAATGELYYYRMTSTGLASGVKVGTGWNSTIHIQQVKEIFGQFSGNTLVAIRKDRTVWVYDNPGNGRVSNGRQLGRLPADADNFAITQLNNPSVFGQHVLLARRGSILHAWAITQEGLTDVGLPAAAGWGTTSRTLAMSNFTGSVQGDLVGVRTDGTMWLAQTDGFPYAETSYPKRKQIGHGWQSTQVIVAPGSTNGDALPDLVARRTDGNLYTYVNKGGVWAPAKKIGANWQSVRLLG